MKNDKETEVPQITKEAEILTSGGTTIEIQRGSKHTRIKLNILHHADDDQLCGEEFLSLIRAAFKAPDRGSHWRHTFGGKLNQTCKVLANIKSTFQTIEAAEENDSALLRNFSGVLNECSRVFLPILAFDLDACRMEVESILECIRLDNELKSEPCQIDPLPTSPAQPVSPRVLSPNTSNTNPPQNSGNGQTEKSDKSRTALNSRLTERLKAYKFTETNDLRTELPPTKL